MERSRLQGAHYCSLLADGKYSKRNAKVNQISLSGFNFLGHTRIEEMIKDFQIGCIIK